ncbi:MAG: P27 family phage terminase small subunit, partial [Dehalococcoidales bacterium]
GNYIQQPLIGIANTAARDMVKYASEFGLTPAARASLGIKNEPRGRSKFDGLIGIKGGKKQ